MNTNTSNINETTTGQNQTNTKAAGGSDLGGLSASSGQLILGQQAEILAKIELLVESQARLEQVLQNSLQAGNAVLAALGLQNGERNRVKISAENNTNA